MYWFFTTEGRAPINTNTKLIEISSRHSRVLFMLGRFEGVCDVTQEPPVDFFWFLTALEMTNILLRFNLTKITHHPVPTCTLLPLNSRSSLLSVMCNPSTQPTTERGSQCGVSGHWVRVSMKLRIRENIAEGVLQKVIRHVAHIIPAMVLYTFTIWPSAYVFGRDSALQIVLMYTPFTKHSTGK